MRTFAEVVRWWAQRQPDLPATWVQGRTRTWAELNESITRLAAGMVKSLGIRRGDHVAILDNNSDRYLELLFALDKAGAIATPVNWRLTGPEVAKIVGDAEAVAIVSGREALNFSHGVRCAPRR